MQSLWRRNGGGAPPVYGILPTRERRGGHAQVAFGAGSSGLHRAWGHRIVACQGQRPKRDLKSGAVGYKRYLSQLRDHQIRRYGVSSTGQWRDRQRSGLSGGIANA